MLRHKLAWSFFSLILADMAMAFLWVLTNALLRISVDVISPYLGFHGIAKQLLSRSLILALLFFFYGLSKVTGGATYNPLTVIAYAAANVTHDPLYFLSFRVPAQIMGAVWGAFASVSFTPEAYKSLMTGPYLRVHPHVGALVEAALTFGVVFIFLTVYFKGPKSGIRRTWISSISRISLSILGANYTGPAMNPANAFGWAVLRNKHNTWEHIYVYWIGPLTATLVAAWLARAMFAPRKVKEKES